MKYFEVDFVINAPAELLQDARDIVSALAGEAGFETFEDTENGVKGYVQQADFVPEVLDVLLRGIPFNEVKVKYRVEEAEDRDWNEQWEQEGFDPIVVENRVLVHDGRHLGGRDFADYEHAIEIDARMAFGTGTHETTRLMLAALLKLDLKGLRVLDCGCGTGILGIAALKLGASGVVGYDIDEWSVDNARHNAVINGVDGQYTSLLGDASVLQGVQGKFNVVMANINRNILLADMPAFRKKLEDGGTLLLSGFYADDIPLLREKAGTLGLQLVSSSSEGMWHCLCCQA